MDTEKIRGIAVVSLNDGKRLGAVDHALFDPATLDLQALQVTGDGQTFVIPWHLVRAVGAAAVMVASNRTTMTAARGGAFGKLVDLRTLQRLKVMDAAGTLAGTISDVESDPATGRALLITVSKGGFLSRFGETTVIDASAIRGIGTDIVTVAVAGTTANARTGPSIATP